MEKTNVMRMLDQKKISYMSHCYLNTGAISGIEVAKVLKEDPKKVFKTLVTISSTNHYYVFVIPVAEELDLKKAAKAVNEKSISMLKQKDLLPLTGYIHRGCSPIKKKKVFKTVLHVSAKSLDTIMISAGKIGYQVELNYQELEKFVPLELHDIIIDKK